MKHIKLFEDVMPKLSTDGSLDSVIITSTSTGQNNFFIGINKPDQIQSLLYLLG